MQLPTAVIKKLGFSFWRKKKTKVFKTVSTEATVWRIHLRLHDRVVTNSRIFKRHYEILM